MFSNPEKILIQFGISPGVSVADFGTGAGFYAKLLAEKVGNMGKVYAIDINKEMLSRVAKEAEKEGLDNLEIVHGNVEKVHGSKLADSLVDDVVIANTLFSMEDKLGAAKEALRVMHKKGRVLLVEWSDSFAGMGPHRDHVIKKEDAEKIFKEAGFTLERELEAGDHHYGLVFRK